MSEQLSTRRCDTPLLQAFVDNRTILVKIAARITGCRSRAEDVVQDAFFRLQSAPQITSSFKAQLSYLFQIVRNLAIDHYRKQALEQKYSGPEEEGLNVVIQGASPETSHINYATLEHIADALTELPKRTRYAFEMYRLHGVPQKDIAKELGVSPTLVNFMIRDALVHCRKVTAERQGDKSGEPERASLRHRGRHCACPFLYWRPPDASSFFPPRQARRQRSKNRSRPMIISAARLCGKSNSFSQWKHRLCM